MSCFSALFCLLRRLWALPSGSIPGTEEEEARHMFGLGRWVVGGVTFLAAMALTQHADAANGVVGPGNCDEGGFASVL
ncbi:MAG: hypothetical protein ABIW82_11220, partial [Dokdonella sp.]